MAKALLCLHPTPSWPAGLGTRWPGAVLGAAKPFAAASSLAPVPAPSWPHCRPGREERRQV